MEWSTIEERIQKDKIKYRFRLEYMEENLDGSVTKENSKGKEIELTEHI